MDRMQLKSSPINNDKMSTSPVVIAGVGGSGTRVIAEIIQRVGFYTGDFLNESLDNLWFTFLFKRPQWLFALQKQHNTIEIQKTLSVFEQIMTGQFQERPQTLLALSKAAKEYIQWQDYYKKQLAINTMSEYPEDYVKSVIFAPAVQLAQYRGWGWKEPNTHLYLKYLCDYFPNLRYIHLIRNGLDMAYSDNQQQYFNWGGSLFNIPWIEDIKQRPRGSLEYWIQANQLAIQIATDCLKERFLLVQFEQLCLNPIPELERLLKFVGITDYSEADLVKLAALPKLPKSYQRFQKQDLSVFTESQLQSVRQFGYSST